MEKYQALRTASGKWVNWHHDRYVESETGRWEKVLCHKHIVAFDRDHAEKQIGEPVSIVDVLVIPVDANMPAKLDFQRALVVIDEAYMEHAKRARKGHEEYCRSLLVVERHLQKLADAIEVGG